MPHPDGVNIRQNQIKQITELAVCIYFLVKGENVWEFSVRMYNPNCMLLLYSIMTNICFQLHCSPVEWSVFVVNFIGLGVVFICIYMYLCTKLQVKHVSHTQNERLQRIQENLLSPRKMSVSRMHSLPNDSYMFRPVRPASAPYPLQEVVPTQSYLALGTYFFPNYFIYFLSSIEPKCRHWTVN